MSKIKYLLTTKRRSIKKEPFVNIEEYYLPDTLGTQIQGYTKRYTPVLSEQPDNPSQEPEVPKTEAPGIASGYIFNPPKPEKKGPEIVVPFLPGQHDTFGQQYETSNVQQKDKYREYFRKMAERESSMRSSVQRKDTLATGYFQFLPDNIRAFYKGSDFKNDPIGQIEAMEKFTDANLKMLNDNDLAKAEAKGYSMSALAAGMHLGGLKGVRRVLNDTGNPKDANGTSVTKYMNEFNGMFKNGGILKRK